MAKCECVNPDLYGHNGYCPYDEIEVLRTKLAVMSNEGRKSMVLAEELSKAWCKLHSLEQFKEWAEPQITDRGELLSRLDEITKSHASMERLCNEQSAMVNHWVGLHDSLQSRLSAIRYYCEGVTQGKLVGYLEGRADFAKKILDLLEGK